MPVMTCVSRPCRHCPMRAPLNSPGLNAFHRDLSWGSVQQIQWSHDHWFCAGKSSVPFSEIWIWVAISQRPWPDIWFDCLSDCWLVDCLVWLVDWLFVTFFWFDWLVDCSWFVWPWIDWLVDWLIDQLIDWLTDRLTDLEKLRSLAGGIFRMKVPFAAVGKSGNRASMYVENVHAQRATRTYVLRTCVCLHAFVWFVHTNWGVNDWSWRDGRAQSIYLVMTGRQSPKFCYLKFECLYVSCCELVDMSNLCLRFEGCVAWCLRTQAIAIALPGHMLPRQEVCGRGGACNGVRNIIVISYWLLL